MNLPVAAIIENFGQLIALFCVIGGLLIGLALPAIALYFHHRRQQLWHETARLALEKGQPVPASFETLAGPQRAAQPRNDIRSGLILIAVGAGLILFFYNSWLRYLGAIPGCIGAALLLYGLFSTVSARKDLPADRPPRS